MSMLLSYSASIKKSSRTSRVKCRQIKGHFDSIHFFTWERHFHDRLINQTFMTHLIQSEWISWSTYCSCLANQFSSELVMYPLSPKTLSTKAHAPCVVYITLVKFRHKKVRALWHKIYLVKIRNNLWRLVSNGMRGPVFKLMVDFTFKSTLRRVNSPTA